MTGVGRPELLVVAALAGFCAGVLVDGWLRAPGPAESVETALTPPQMPAAPTVAAVQGPVDRLTTSVDRLPVFVELPEMSAAPVATIDARSTTDTKPTTHLRMPIDGTSLESFKGGFAEKRGSRAHEAVDIIVPRGTAIHAVQDGTIARLFFSQFGGITIYQFDPDGRLCYYYAHLDRYADGLSEGQHVSQDQVIGYVGSSGNATPDAPHLHFAVFELKADRKWWQGRPLDPYLVFKERN